MRTPTSLWATALVSLAVFAGAGNARGDGLAAADLRSAYDLRWNATAGDLTGGDGFAMVSETLDINADKLTFAPTFAGSGKFSLVGGSLVIADGAGNEEVLQARFDDTGRTLTLLDEIDGTLETFVFTRRGGSAGDVTLSGLQGHYDLDVARTTFKRSVPLTAGELIIAGNIVTASLTYTQTRTFTLAGDVITLFEEDGSTTRLRATLSRDRRTLTLEFVADGTSFTYRRR